ncbi:MAG TPA: glycosyltransferase [Candidatus Binatia bacterium]|nr:glycosyltransferase [Candidatus Binatia bacterium]
MQLVRDTLLVVPCFNEVGRLTPERFEQFVRSHADIGFLFVNDGSTDSTRELVERLAAQHPGVIAAHSLAENQGKAEAVRVGINVALAMGPSFVGYWDADLSTPLDEIVEFRDALRARPILVCVMGCRVRRLGADVRRKNVRHYLGRIFATLASIALRLGVYDTQCGAKLFRVNEATRDIFSTPFLSRWVFDVELLARLCARARARDDAPEAVILEYPLAAWQDVEGSKLRSLHMLQALSDLLRIARAYR